MEIISDLLRGFGSFTMWHYMDKCGCAESCQALFFSQLRKLISHLQLQNSYIPNPSYSYQPFNNSPNFLSFLQVDNSFFTPWNWNPNHNNNSETMSDNAKQYMSFPDDASLYDNFDGFLGQSGHGLEEEEEYDDEYYDETEEDWDVVDELCEVISKNEGKKVMMMAKFEGKHTRFVYNSDDELEGTEECGVEAASSLP